jgi:hypothetical protein
LNSFFLFKNDQVFLKRNPCINFPKRFTLFFLPIKYIYIYIYIYIREASILSNGAHPVSSVCGLVLLLHSGSPTSAKATRTLPPAPARCPCCSSCFDSTSTHRPDAGLHRCVPFPISFRPCEQPVSRTKPHHHAFRLPFAP